MSNHSARWNLELSFSSSLSIVTGAPGTVPRGFRIWLRDLGMLYCMERLQRITLLSVGKDSAKGAIKII